MPSDRSQSQSLPSVQSPLDGILQLIKLLRQATVADVWEGVQKA